jgi:ABC-type nickel/cobalt efflux system permease component RcnA
MRTVGIWASGLLTSAIPFIFVGAVVAFSACVFDAQGEHALPARSRVSFQGEAAPPERALAVASADAPDDVAQRQSGKHAHRYADARRHHHAPPRRSRFHSRVKRSPFEFGFGRAAFANEINCYRCWSW